MVPFRFIGEMMGAVVGWNGDTRTANFTLGSTSLSLPMGQAIVVNGRDLGTPEIIDGRTLVPVRYVSDMMGAEVRWDRDERAAYVTFMVDELPTLAPPIDETPEPVNNGGLPATAQGNVVRVQYGDLWGNLTVKHAFTADTYNVTFDVLHKDPRPAPDGGFGICPLDRPQGGYVFEDASGQTLGMFGVEEFPAGVWNRISFTFPGNETGGGLTFATFYGATGRTPGHYFFMDNIVIRNSAGTIVYSNDFENGLAGVTGGEWANDVITVVPKP
jgi:hypothetical protein